MRVLGILSTVVGLAMVGAGFYGRAYGGPLAGSWPAYWLFGIVVVLFGGACLQRERWRLPKAPAPPQGDPETAVQEPPNPGAGPGLAAPQVVRQVRNPPGAGGLNIDLSQLNSLGLALLALTFAVGLAALFLLPRLVPWWAGVLSGRYGGVAMVAVVLILCPLVFVGGRKALWAMGLSIYRRV